MSLTWSLIMLKTLRLSKQYNDDHDHDHYDHDNHNDEHYDDEDYVEFHVDYFYKGVELLMA